MRPNPTVVAYVSGHGYGHAARTGLILKAMRKLMPSVHIVVRSSTPAWMFPTDTVCIPVAVDVGVIQVDSLTPLIDETVARAYAFEIERPSLVEAETQAIAPLDPNVIISDIPALGFDVAARLGVPSIAIGNFGWDWIYHHIGSVRPELDELVARIADSESRANLLLRLPLHEPMAAFPRKEDVPLVAHPSDANRAKTRRRILTGRGKVAGETRLALLSFGGMGLRSLDLRALARSAQTTFVLPTAAPGRVPENVIAYPADLLYHDVLAACDAVIMKPGYGTVADCLANRVPMVYATRPGFEEERILVSAMHELGRAARISNDDLYAGILEPAIEEAVSQSSPWCEVPRDASERIAQRILDSARIQAPE